jgi:broad specificity phosphatase PhoE
MLLATLVAASAVSASSLDRLGPVPPGGVRVFLVRHGQALSNLDHPPDLPPEALDHLTDLGRAQASRAGAALRPLGIRLVLTSPASRARETAEAVLSSLPGVELRVEPRIRPLDLGRSPRGAPLDWDARIAEWKAGRDPVPAAGESLAQAGERARDLVSSLAASHRGAGVVLVSHGEVIGSFAGLLQGTPATARYPPAPANGSITVVEATAGAAPVLVEANVVPEDSSSSR